MLFYTLSFSRALEKITTSTSSHLELFDDKVQDLEPEEIEDQITVRICTKSGIQRINIDRVN